MSKLTTIDFHGAKLVAIAGDRPENTLVAMPPIVEGMGLNWEGQRKKIMAHPVLSKGASVTVVPSEGGPQEMTCLSLDLLNFWLATIHPDRIKDEAVRAKVIEYQTECARVLFNHFFGKAIAQGDHLTAQQTGGIVKSGLGKLKREMMAEIRAEFAPMFEVMKATLVSFDPTAGFTTEYRPMRYIVDKHDFPRTQSRASLIRAMSRRCTTWLLRNDMGGAMRSSRDIERRLFHIDALDRWMAAEGNMMIQIYRDRVIGQNTIPFPKARRGKPS